MEIQACPKCASRELHLPTLSDGGILGYSTTASVACSQCSYQGAPLLFRRLAEYEQFRLAVAGGEQPGTQDDGEAPDPDLEAFLQEPERKHPGTSRGSAALLALLGVGILVATPLLVFGAFGGIEGGGMLVVPTVLTLGLQVLECWAIFRIVRRMWRGHPLPLP